MKEEREGGKWTQTVCESKAQLASSCAPATAPVRCINFADTCNFNLLSKQSVKVQKQQDMRVQRVTVLCEVRSPSSSLLRGETSAGLVMVFSSAAPAVTDGDNASLGYAPLQMLLIRHVFAAFVVTPRWMCGLCAHAWFVYVFVRVLRCTGGMSSG